MEDNFYLDDFELSLKEQANQFKMIPSKRVWHGIYNDMHPGRRWPSVTIALLLIISIVFVGYINTHKDGKLSASKPETSLKNNMADVSQPGSVIRESQISETLASHKLAPKVTDAKTTKEIASASLINKKDVSDIAGDNNISRQKNQAADISNSEDIQHTILPVVIKDAQVYQGQKFSNSSISNSKVATEIESNIPLKNNIYSYLLTSKELKPSPSIPREQIGKNISLETNLPGTVFLKNPTSDNSLLPNKVNETDAKSSGNNSTTPSQDMIAAHQSKHYKTTWVYYGGISVNTVSFSGNYLNEIINQNAFSLPQVRQKDNKTIHSPAIGFEAGVQMNYSIAKKLELTAGAHFTRSGYNIVSNEVHPTLTSLLLKDKSTGAIYSRNFVTHYGDGTGQSTITLHNYSFQASMPLGVQYEVSGNSKIQFNLGVNIEPSFVLKSNAYILSTDGRNYMNIPDLNRKWNLSSNFAPFITFRAYKLKWNVGPNIRYQWLSSYMDDYTIKEHLINYGLRIGVGK